jgi:hypothetical protein
VFVTSEGSPYARFKRCIANRALWGAEDAARELDQLPLEDALQLVYLYAEKDSPKYEKAALRWLERYLAEEEPRLMAYATMAASLAERSRSAGDISP